MRICSFSTAVLVALVVLTSACQSSSPPTEEALVVDVAPDDAGTSDTDALEVVEEGDATDVDADGNEGPMTFEPSRWDQPNGCDGDVTFPDDDTPFEMPNRPPDWSHNLTRQDIEDRMPLQGFIVAPNPELEPGEGVPFSLYAERGTDVRIHTYTINNYESDVLESFRLNMSIMVDYEPVEATYERWDPARQEKLFEMSRTGINYPIEFDFEIIDVTIPGDVFNEDRMYEISLNVESNTIERRPNGLSRRFALYHGGYDRPGRPCAEPSLNDDLVDIELQFLSRISDDVGILFFEGIDHRDQVRKVIDVAPGETLRLFLSVLRKSDVPRPTVLIPALNGEPIAEPWWVTQGGGVESRYGHVDARKTFEVTFPDETGIYEVQVLSWVNPFELVEDRDGNDITDVTFGELNENSNALRFRVTDPSSAED